MKYEVTKEEYELLEVIKNSNVEEFANNHTWYIRYKLKQGLILKIINDKENRQMFVDKLVHVLQQECREYDEIISSVGKKDKVDLKFQL